MNLLTNDVQNSIPDVTIKIDRVGVKRVRRIVSVNTPKGLMNFNCELEAYIDLPATQRGVHMSRNIEAFIEAIDEARNNGASCLEEMVERSGKKLLEKHPYASRAEVIVNTSFFYDENFLGMDTQEVAEVKIKSSIDRDDHRVRCVSVTLEGMTACPCAQATYSEMEKTEITQTPTHTQRARLTISVTNTLTDNENKIARIEWLINAARNSFSSPVISLLKRIDEYKLIKNAIHKPRFAEDVARFAIINTAKKLYDEGFPLNTVIRVEIESFESIHPHNVYAFKEASLKELIEENNYKNHVNCATNNS
jgi:GTP cyclohydrolase-4